MTTENSTQTSPTTPAEPAETPEPAPVAETSMGAAYEDAYTHTLPMAQALDAGALGVFNVEVEFAVGTVLKKLALLTTLRALMTALPTFDVVCLDELGNSARALAYAHALYGASNTVVDLADVRLEAIALRSQLKDDARVLVRRGVLKRALLANLANTTGDGQLGGDLLALFAAFRAEPDKLAGKTAVTAAELERAATLANTLMLGVAQREAPRTEESVALADVRRRVFTLFLRNYTQVQRAVAFLRFDAGDADHYAPSLYATHAKHPKRAKTAAPKAAPKTPVAPASPAPVAPT